MKFHFNYVKNAPIYFIITGVIVIIGIVSFVVRGFNWDIDFTGGTVMQYQLNTPMDSKDAQDALSKLVSDLIGKTPEIQAAGNPPTQVIIKLPSIDTATRDSITNMLKENYSISDSDILSIDNITPVVGTQLRNSALLAMGVAIVLMLIYITIRFEFQSALAAIIGLAFDVFVTITAYSLFHVPVNSTVIASILTILGYSINATVIVFDRVRETRRLYRNSDFSTCINSSVNHTLTRTINTTVTVLITSVAIMIFGVTQIRDFVFPMMFGFASGVFTSTCLAGQLWNLFHNMGTKKPTTPVPAGKTPAAASK